MKYCILMQSKHAVFWLQLQSLDKLLDTIKQKSVCIFISLECWCLTLSVYINFSYPSIMLRIQLQSGLASTTSSFIFLLHKQGAQLRCFVSFRDFFFPNKDFSFTFTPKSMKCNERRAMQKAARKPVGIIGSCSY